MTAVKTSRAFIVAWGVAVMTAYAVPDSAPAWIRYTIAAVVLAPVAVLLVAWPVLLVWNLRPVTAPAQSTGVEPRSNIQVLPVPSSGQDGAQQR